MVPMFQPISIPPGTIMKKYRRWFRGEFFKFPRRRRLFPRRRRLFLGRMHLCSRRRVMFLWRRRQFQQRRRLFLRRKRLFPQNMHVFLRVCTEKRWPLWATVGFWRCSWHHDVRHSEISTMSTLPWDGTMLRICSKHAKIWLLNPLKIL